MTMMSADATGSLMTSTHPASRRTSPRMEGTATMAAAANVTTTTRIEADLSHRWKVESRLKAKISSSGVSPRHAFDLPLLANGYLSYAPTTLFYAAVGDAPLASA